MITIFNDRTSENLMFKCKEQVYSGTLNKDPLRLFLTNSSWRLGGR